jgi:hypothetical protein
VSVPDVDGCYRHSAFGALLAHIFDSTGCCSYRAAHPSDTKAMYDLLVPYTAFLQGEGIGDGCGTIDFSVRTQHCGQVPNADVQVHILQPERHGIACRAGIPPGRTRKKNVVVIMPATAWVSSWRAIPYACVSMQMMMTMRMDFTRLGDESSHL